LSKPPVHLPLESDRLSRPAAVPRAGGSTRARSAERPGPLRPDALRAEVPTAAAQLAGVLPLGEARPGAGSRGPRRPGAERPPRHGGRSGPVTLLPLLGSLALLVGGCVRPEQHNSGRVFPLPRHSPDDGLAVVTGPGGVGLHIWLDPDTETAGICRPRWNPDPARLSGGDGPSPRSSGRAPRQEFYAALRRGPVRSALRRQMARLCHQRAPTRRFQWQAPPRSDAEFLPVLQPLLEEEHLLSYPNAVRRAEKQLLGLPLTPKDWDDTPPPPAPEGP